MTDIDAAVRWKSLDIAMEFSRAKPDGLGLISDMLENAISVQTYLMGASKIEVCTEGPIADEIPFTGEGEVVRIREVEVPAAEFDTADPEPKKASTRKAKPAKKPKAVRKTKARDEAPTPSQNDGSQVPDSGDRVPDNDAADPNTSLAA